MCHTDMNVISVSFNSSNKKNKCKILNCSFKMPESQLLSDVNTSTVLF